MNKAEMENFSARVIIVTPGNKFLMMKRTKPFEFGGEPYYVIIGGTMEEGETPEQCVVREAFEESGSTLTTPEFLFKDTESDGHVQYYYIARELKRETPTGEEWTTHDPKNTYALVEFKADELEELNLVPKSLKSRILRAFNVFCHSREGGNAGSR
jgi:8-oxo-dGTP pyrophosphatase MutT (NUDIX family)